MPGSWPVVAMLSEAVVIAADDLDALEDTVDTLSNPAAVR